MYRVFKTDSLDYDSDKQEVFVDVLGTLAEVYAATTSRQFDSYYVVYRDSNYHTPDFVCYYYKGERRY